MLAHLGFPAAFMSPLPLPSSGQPFPVLLLPVFLFPPLSVPVSSSFSSATRPESAFCHPLAEKSGPSFTFPSLTSDRFTEMPGSVGSQRVEHDLGTEQERPGQQQTPSFRSPLKSKAAAIPAPLLDFPSFTMLPFKLIF